MGLNGLSGRCNERPFQGRDLAAFALPGVPPRADRATPSGSKRAGRKPIDGSPPDRKAAGLKLADRKRAGRKAAGHRLRPEGTIPPARGETPGTPTQNQSTPAGSFINVPGRMKKKSFQDELREWLRRYGIRCSMGSPIIARGAARHGQSRRCDR
jgi:hypothetical protein